MSTVTTADHAAAINFWECVYKDANRGFAPWPCEVERAEAMSHEELEAEIDRLNESIRNRLIEENEYILLDEARQREAAAEAAWKAKWEPYYDSLESRLHRRRW